MNIQWTEELSVGVGIIDKQHKHLFEIMNSLHEAMSSGEPKDKIGEILDEVRDFAIYHFATEEKYFDLFKYRLANEHKAKHKEMLTEVEKLIKLHKSGKAPVAIQTVYFLENWIEEHLAKEDKKYTECFQSHGLV